MVVHALFYGRVSMTHKILKDLEANMRKYEMKA
jgi:hypothetical protein